VLDLLNSPYGAFSLLRDSASKYLAAQPAQLLAPTQLMVLANQSLDMIQGYTPSRADLLSALDRVPRKLPFKIGREWGDGRLSQSIQASSEDRTAEQERIRKEKHCLAGIRRSKPVYGYSRSNVFQIITLLCARHNQRAGRCANDPIHDLSRTEWRQEPG
jgi:hypothetical protein